MSRNFIKEVLAEKKLAEQVELSLIYDFVWGFEEIKSVQKIKNSAWYFSFGMLIAGTLVCGMAGALGLPLLAIGLISFFQTMINPKKYQVYATQETYIQYGGVVENCLYLIAGKDKMMELKKYSIPTFRNIQPKEDHVLIQSSWFAKLQLYAPTDQLHILFELLEKIKKEADI